MIPKQTGLLRELERYLRHSNEDRAHTSRWTCCRTPETVIGKAKPSSYLKAGCVAKRWGHETRAATTRPTATWTVNCVSIEGPHTTPKLGTDENLSGSAGIAKVIASSIRERCTMLFPGPNLSGDCRFLTLHFRHGEGVARTEAS